MKKKLLLTAITSLSIVTSALAQIPAYVPTSGLIAYLPFNGNALDQSGNANNGTVNGSTLTSDRLGNTNSAYDFNGTSDYIEVADNSALRLNNTDFTMSVWIYETSRASVQESIISKRTGAGGNGYILNMEGSVQAIPGLSNFHVSGGADPRAYSNTVVPLNAWKHILLTYQFSSQTLKTYINGMLDNTTTGIPSPNAATSVAMRIGTDAAGNPYFFHGKIDDIAIYNRLLSNTEISQLFTSVCASDITSGLLSRYDFNGNANDQSGNGHNGTVNGASLSSDRFGNVNSAYSFDGVDDYIGLNTTLGNFGTQDFSISGWIKPNVAKDGNSIFAKRDAGSNGNFFQFTYSGCEINESSSANYNSIGSTYNFNIGNWYHVVMKRTGLTIKFYINNTLDMTLTTSVIQNINNTAMSTIGGRFFNTSPVDFFNGAIDDIRVYNRGLSDCDIDSLFNTTNSLSTGISKQIYSNTINIYPNPASTYIYIDNVNYKTSTAYTIKITNTIGQVVFTSTINQSKYYVDASQWSGTGIYFVQIIDSINNTIETRKIVLQ